MVHGCQTFVCCNLSKHIAYFMHWALVLQKIRVLGILSGEYCPSYLSYSTEITLYTL